MSWKNKKKKNTVTKYSKYSIINKLKSENKITNNTLNNINNISLEDLIAIKLELSTRYLCGKLYGIPIWRLTRHAVTDALLKTALSIARTKKEAARFLGINLEHFKKLIKKYDTESYFNDLDNN